MEQQECASGGEAGLREMESLNLQDEAAGASSSATIPEQDNNLASPVPAVSNNVPGFKYKYPQAAPTPPGVDDTEWNKIYTAADSRNYNRHHKSAIESKKYRERGETYQLALKMLEEKREKAKKVAEGGLSTPKSTQKAKAPATAKKSDFPATIKKETSTASRDASPGGDKMTMGIAEKIKSEGRARKTSSVAPSDHGTPGPSSAPKMSSPAPPPAKMEKPAPKKRGTATTVKKPGPKPKNRGGKSGTPSSAGPRRPASRGNESTGSSSDDQRYCICKGRDDHRLMVECEAEDCDEWYHCSCLGMDEDDVNRLLDRFICPKCKTDKLFTTWRRVCRYSNVGKELGIVTCRNPARVGDDEKPSEGPPSKYCSEECKIKFMQYLLNKVRDDDKPSMGGALNRAEVSFLIKDKNIAQIHALGQKPRLPKKEGADPNRPVGLDYLTPEEEQEIEEIKKKKAVLQDRIKLYQDQLRVLKMMIQRAKIAAQQPNLEVKDICGYDNRLAMNEAQFARWCQSIEGKTALETGVLGPRTDEVKDINAHIPFPGQVIPEAPTVPDALNNICLKNRKKCKHLTWRELHNQDFMYQAKLLRDELDKLTKVEEEIIDDAETREATKDYYSDNVTIQMF